MAIINTLRNKAGKVVVVAITITMAAFVLGDITANNSFLGGEDRDIAEIDGKDITYEDFQAKVDELSYAFALNTGRNPQGDEMDQVKNQAWQSFFVENAFYPEFRSVGLNISDAEIVDMVQGDNTHPHVMQMMANPQTGQFDKSYITTFLQQIKNSPPQQQEAWERFEGTLASSKKMMRLDAFMDKSNYVTSAEAKTQHEAQNSNATLEYVYVPFSSINDSSVAVTEAEMKGYLNENKKEFDRDESRDAVYVTFSIDPSGEDSVVIKGEMRELIEGLSNATGDSIYATLNSDGRFPFMTYRKSSLPEYVLTDDQPIAKGEVSGPFTLQDRMMAYKMSRIEEGPEFEVKASHILLKWADDSDEAKAEAKRKAQDVLRRARRGEDFSDLAAENSEDEANAQRGGDLGWFGENSSMAQPFKDACFGHSGTGVIPEVIESTFGYHIIKIDEPKDNTQFKVAIIEKEFFVSNETLEDAYREASLFKTSVSDASEFITKAEEQGLKVEKQSRINTQAERLGGLTNARSIVLWLFNNAEFGSVSDVFELDNKYVIAAMTGIQEKGLARLKDVENQVTLKVRNEKKSRIIKDKLSGLGEKTLEEIVSSYGQGAKSGEATVTLSLNSISGVGLAPNAVGVVFAMEEGDQTEPIETSNGVLVMKLISKVSAEDVEDYSVYQQQLANQRNSRKVIISDFPFTYFRVMIGQDLEKAMKELSGLEDKRHKFF